MSVSVSPIWSRNRLQASEAGAQAAPLPCSEPGCAALPLRVNFSWTLAGNVVYAACQWGILAVLAKLGSPELVGTWTLGLAVAAPVIALSKLNLRGIQATDVIGEYRFQHYFQLRLATTILAIGAILAIAVTAEYRRDIQLIILGAAAYMAIDAVSDVIYGLFQQRQRLDRIARSMMLRGVISLAAIAVAVSLTQSVLAGVAAATVARIAVFWWYDLPGARWMTASSRNAESAQRAIAASAWDVPVLFRLAWRSLPLGVVMMLISVQSNLPRYFIAGHSGEHNLGIYAAVSQLTLLATMILCALGDSATPRLASSYAMGDYKGFRRVLGYLLGVAIVLGVGGIVLSVAVGKPLLTLMYRPEYGDYANVLQILMVAAAVTFVGNVLGGAAVASRRIKLQPFIQVGTLATIAVSCWALVDYGLVGIAWSSLIASVVTVMLFTILLCLPEDRHR